MNVLIVGSGGREHAIAWKVKDSSHTTHIFCAPGNAGISKVATCVPIKAEDVAELKDFAIDMKVDLTIVGPEAPLAAGIVDAFCKEGLPVFGPTRAAAQMEASKSFAKTIMRRMNIPTARSSRHTETEAAIRGLDEFEPPYVIKADGLAAGKGVIIAEDRKEAEAAVRQCLDENTFGEAGKLVLLEEYLEGEELSVLALTDGRNVLSFEPAQDHKRIFDDDKGPNTGGMGAYSPVPQVEPKTLAEVEEKILKPAVEGMAEQGTPYRGILYAGLVLTSAGPKVIEFNCRLGDPEAQAVLPRLKDDLLIVMMESVGVGLQRKKLNFSDEAAVCIVASSGGYPGKYKTGLPISGIEEATKTGALVFHAGTKLSDSQTVTAGGRVLNVVGRGPDLASAAKNAYSAIEKIRFEGIHYRRDIAARALKRSKTKK